MFHSLQMKKQVSNEWVLQSLRCRYFWTNRYEAGSQFNNHFSFQWQYIALADDILQAKAESLIQSYINTVSEDFVKSLKS